MEEFDLTEDEKLTAEFSNGYRTGHSEIKANRYTFGGLTDKGFQMIPLLEAGLNQGWPWENDSK